MSETEYDRIIGELFVRFPSFQKVGAGAYKPGIDRMMEFDALIGHPHSLYPTIHVAGTNGKGSVCSMLASVCASAGLRTGLYTSPHIKDFRERMRIIDLRSERGAAGGTACTGAARASNLQHIGKGELPNFAPVSEPNVRYIAKGEVLDFLQLWRGDMDRLDLSFFEITTAMAFNWFAAEKVDMAIIETGLGGRLDSTNIITPILSIVTNIGYDHCDMLGNELWQIAGEKAGIFKRGVPALVGESHPETDPVFRAKASEVQVSSLTFADKTEPSLWRCGDEILRNMDLQGAYQQKNLRTVLAAVDLLSNRSGTSTVGPLSNKARITIADTISDRDWTLSSDPFSDKAGMAAGDGVKDSGGCILAGVDKERIIDGIQRTAARTQFHGRWEKLCDTPYVIADIGHNSHGLCSNFAQLEDMMRSGTFSSLRIVYGTMADKDVDEVMKFFPRDAEYWFVTVSNKRAMPAEEIMDHYVKAGLDPGHAHCSTLASALSAATKLPTEAAKPIWTMDSGTGTGLGSTLATVTKASAETTELAPVSDPQCLAGPLVYIGGSAYLVSEALPLLGQLCPSSNNEI